MPVNVSADGISVVIPLYNKAGQIARALDSVLAQTFQDFEIIVVDDGSKDASAAIVAGYNDPRIRIHRQPNGGVSVARNQGAALARTNVIAFLDGDDAWYPHHLQTLDDMRRSLPEAAAWAVNYHLVALDGSKALCVPAEKVPPGRIILTPANFFRLSQSGNTPVFSSAVAVDKAALLRVGGFPIGVRLGEDIDTWIRLLFDGQILFDPRPGAFYYADGDERALVRHAPLLRYVFFDTDEAWVRAHPAEAVVADDIEEFHNFFRIVHAYYHVRYGERSNARAVLRQMRTRVFSLEKRKLLLMSYLPKAFYEGALSVKHRIKAVLNSRARIPSESTHA